MKRSNKNSKKQMRPVFHKVFSLVMAFGMVISVMMITAKGEQQYVPVTPNADSIKIILGDQTKTVPSVTNTDAGYEFTIIKTGDYPADVTLQFADAWGNLQSQIMSIDPSADTITADISLEYGNFNNNTIIKNQVMSGKNSDGKVKLTFTTLRREWDGSESKIAGSFKIKPSTGGPWITVNGGEETVLQFDYPTYTISEATKKTGTISVPGTQTIDVKFVDNEGHPIAGETINYVVDGVEGVAISDSNGIASFTRDNYIASDKMKISVSVDPEDGGTVTGAGSYDYGEIVTLTPTPNNNYMFDKWTEGENTIQLDPEDPAYPSYIFTAEENRDLTACFKGIPYTIFFVDSDEKELQKKDIAYGETPSYTGDTPVKEGDEQYTYTFIGWTDGKNNYDLSDDLPKVMGPAIYIARYSNQLNEYTVVFVEESGKELQSGALAYGETPAYKGKTPTKEGDARYTYTFSGWTDGTKNYGISDTLPTVTDDATYTATYSSTVNQYTVAFVDESGKELQSGALAYGETPAYKGKTPTKEGDARYTYTFSGWTDGTKNYGISDTLPTVTGAATYTATYSSIINQYKITFIDEDGTELQSGPVAYEETPAYTGTIPFKGADANYIYTFSGWTNGSTNYGVSDTLPVVTDAATYKAIYTAIAIEKEATYKVVSGSGSTWTQKTGDALSFTFKRTVNDETTFDHFKGIEVDGKAVPEIDSSGASNWKAKSGSVIIKLQPSFLETLSEGTHTLTINFDDGKSVDVLFTVKQKTDNTNESQTSDSPGANTGDNNSVFLWAAILVTALIGISMTLQILRRTKRPE